MSHMPRAARLLALSALAAAAIACSSKKSTDETPVGEKGAAATADGVTAADRKERDPRVFQRSLGEPEYLDPGLISESEGGVIAHDTFEGLYQYGPTHREWVPGVAKSHEVSPDGRTWTFKLRADSKWSDGTPVTAKDFEWSWKRVLDPKTASRYAGILWVIEGAKDYNQNPDDAKAEALRNAVGVRALDDHTLQVELVAPTPYFLQLTAFYTYAPVPRHVIEKHGDKWARPENIVSNGPWKVIEWTSQQQIVATANPHYWDKASLPFDKIVYRITQESGPAHNMYLGNELDYLDSKIPPSMLTKYSRERFPDMKTTPYLGVYFYMYNVEKPPFDDVRVRRALNLAIDKSKIGKFVVKGGQAPAANIVHPGLEEMGYDVPQGPEFDPEKAKALLTEAGYADPKTFPRFQISYNTLEGHKLVAEYIQQQWKKNLGIECDLDNMEWKVLLKKQHDRDFAVSRSAWIGDYIDPMTFLDLWEGDNPNNRTNWANPKYDGLIAAARTEADPDKRLDLLRQAEEIFLEDVPAFGIYFYVKQDLVKPWVEGYQPHLQGIHASRYFKVKL